MATRNIVPRADNEGSIGTSGKKWNDIRATSATIGTTTTTTSNTTTDNITTANITTLNPGTIIGAGTATTAPIILTSGTNETTPEAGAIEYDGKALYSSYANSQRGVSPSVQFLSRTSNYTLTSTTNSQAAFGATNNKLTLEATTTYLFECILSLASMSATSGNFTFDVLGNGTATLTSVGYFATGLDSTTQATAAAGSVSYHAIAGTGGNIVVAATGTAASVFIKGIIRVNAGGTLIPSVALTTAAAATVNTNSYFMCFPVGTNTITNVGNIA